MPVDDLLGASVPLERPVIPELEAFKQSSESSPEWEGRSPCPPFIWPVPTEATRVAPMDDFAEDRELALGKARLEILAILGTLAPHEQRRVVSALGLDVAVGVSPSRPEPAPQRGQVLQAREAGNGPEVVYAQAPGGLVREVLANATAWLTTTEIIDQALRLDPKLNRRRMYASINKMSNASGAIAKHGTAPTIRYATHEHAAHWGEPNVLRLVPGGATVREAARN